MPSPVAAHDPAFLDYLLTSYLRFRFFVRGWGFCFLCSNLTRIFSYSVSLFGTSLYCFHIASTGAVALFLVAENFFPPPYVATTLSSAFRILSADSSLCSLAGITAPCATGYNALGLGSQVSTVRGSQFLLMREDGRGIFFAMFVNTGETFSGWWLAGMLMFGGERSTPGLVSHDN